VRIIVGTSVAKYYRWPGAYDCRMAYVVGLARLGHEVWLFDDSVKNCFDENYQEVPFEQWEGRQRFEEITRRYEVWPRCFLAYRGGEATHGLSLRQAIDVARDADLLVNINGKLKHPDLLGSVACRAYVDEAPAHTQVYHFEYHVDQGIDQHEHFFTFGLNMGQPTCEVPMGGRRWYPFPVPVVLDHWPAAPDAGGRRFTTISNWSGEPTFKLRGEYSGEKSDNWLRFIDLPKRTSQELEIALNIDPGFAEDIARLQENGWILTDPAQMRTQQDYRRYIAESRAEFSVANNRYSRFRTGWVSDRSARYLASGRPVLVQSTGAESFLPVGKGLLTFETTEEAAEKIKEINVDREAHGRAARAIAQEFFDAERVLSNMLKQIGMC